MDYEIDPVVEWIAAHDRVRRIVGWELLWVVSAVYALGLAAFARTSQSAVTALVDRLIAAGADAGALSAALEREGFPVVADAVVAPLLSGDAGTLALASGVLLLLGSLLLPAATGLLVYVTRTTPGWKPTWGYVAATLAPLAGVVAGLVATPPLAAEFALFALLPIGALFVMVISAFVRPRVLIFLHNVRS